MDKKTLIAYANKAPSYSEEWLSQPEPMDMYELLKKFFISEGKTADIGCGNGRDAGWLSKNGFQVSGFDSSTELLEIASQLYPEVKFKQALLPELKDIQEQFDNVLCETVIMHLPQSDILNAFDNLKRILKENGVLYLSWRVTEGEDARHADGRLYSAFSPELILKNVAKDDILHFEDKISLSSGKRICRLICRK